MARDDQIELEGVISAMPGGGFYEVNILDTSTGQPKGHTVQAKLCGKMKEHKIRVVVGDRVKVAVSPYDLTKGRITRRDRGVTA